MANLWHTIRLAVGMTGTRKAYTGPLWVQIGLANPCNHRCVMCWDHPSHVPKDAPYTDESSRAFYEEHPEINRDKGFIALDKLEELADDLHGLGTRRVELVGRGEPTLHPHFEKAIEILKSRNFHVGLVTNGSRLSRDRCANLVDQGVDRVVVSLNAGTRTTYPLIHTTETPERFDAVLDRLRTLREIKGKARRELPRVMLSFVITEANHREAEEMLERAHEVGADQVVMKYAIPYPGIRFIELDEAQKRAFSRGNPELQRRADAYGIDLKLEPPIGDLTAAPDLYHKKTETVYSKISCYIGWYFSLITAEGSVSPCCQCMEHMGNIEEQSFTEIWKSSRYAGFRERMKKFPERRETSGKCACDECSFDKINTTVYNTLHFYAPVHLYEAQREFALSQLLPAILRGKTPSGARLAKR
jgi:MoaA/NifB/PqqE/SkfB family radical SAM enzyme